MSTRLPIDLPDELPIHGASAEGVQVKPDPEWNARGRRRLRAALEVMAGQSAPISLQTLREAVADAVPLAEYDVSTTKTGSMRAWNDLGWYLTTTYEHSG
jgi:5-methylcytosine-specific restriction enzyme B